MFCYCVYYYSFRTGALCVKLCVHDGYRILSRDNKNLENWIFRLGRGRFRGQRTQVKPATDQPSAEFVCPLASAQTTQFFSSSSKDAAEAASASIKVNRAGNVLFKSVNRFKARSSPPAQGRSPAPPTLRGLTWQVILPDAKQLRLSEDAVLHMRRIVDEFSYATSDNTSRGSTKQRLHQLLFDFFDTFGSHVFRRPACGA